MSRKCLNTDFDLDSSVNNGEDNVITEYLTKETWFANHSTTPTRSKSLVKQENGHADNRKTKSSSVLDHMKKPTMVKRKVKRQHSNESYLSVDFNTQLTRPVSAPLRSTNSFLRTLSSSSSDLNASDIYSITDSSCSSRRQKPLHKRKSKVLCLRAFVNGAREKHSRVTAANMKQLLEECTTKLSLVSAARKIYHCDGTLIRTFDEIKNNSDIYVSCGEPFKDPFGKYKEKERLCRLSTWTMNGVLLPQSETRGKTKPSLSERMKTLVEKQKRRVLVFINADYTNGKEVIAGRFDEFLDDCTKKLQMENEAKAVFDIDGNEINSFSDVAVVDDILQGKCSTIMGPLWVTKSGEKFSFKGPCHFICNLLENTKEKLKKCQQYQNKLELRSDGSDENMSVELMSFMPCEIQNELQMVQKKIYDLESVLPKLKSKKAFLQKKKREEGLTCGSESSIKYQNISEIEENSGLLGRKGIRLKVFENGKAEDEVLVYFNIHEASKGTSDNQSILMSRLLDTITRHHDLPKSGPAGRSVAQKIFRDNGEQIMNVYDLESDDSIWLSYGEPFKSPYTYTLQLVLDKTQSYLLWNEKVVIQREPLNEDEVYGKDKPSLWSVYNGYPSDCKPQDINYDMELPQRNNYEKGLQASQIQNYDTFLQLKKNPSLILYPEISVQQKLAKSSSWPCESQKWLINEDGCIYSRNFPELCLSIKNNQKVEVNYNNETNPVKGVLVHITKRDVSSTTQQWLFKTSGDICNITQPLLVLTWISADTRFSLVDADTMEIYGGEKYCLAVLPKLSSKHHAVGTQRWALKQENLHNIGQWKHSEVPNPEWNRCALSWPTKLDGTRNENFEWPMEGYLICNAPSMKRREAFTTEPPVRLQVRKNGENDARKTVTVIGPDISNMTKDFRGRSLNNINKRSSSHLSTSAEDLKSLELTLLLDRCTQSLQLPFAARRLFDESGHELFSLTGLQRNQLVFVSCGESWLDHKISHCEQQRRLIMTNLASDIAKLRRYCALRNPERFVLNVSSPIQPGSSLNVISLSQKELEESDLQKHGDQEPCVSENDISMIGVRDEVLTAHERAHVRSEERLKTLQWPWEVAITSNGQISVEDKQHGDFEHDVVYSDNNLNKKFRHHSIKNLSTKEFSSYRWCYKEGFLFLHGHTQLVLTAASRNSEESVINEVILSKRKIDDPNQRWILSGDKSIFLRCNSASVLTVTTPPQAGHAGAEGDHQGYEGCSVVLMPRLPENGNANQIWYYDVNTGFIHAFTADIYNKEITAANKAGICTYSVLGSNEMTQLGYVHKDGTTHTFFCDACGKSLRGKLRLEKVKGNEFFSCAMGQNKKPEKSGCFKCLSNRVDMATEEAEATLAMWEEQLTRLKRCSTIRILNKEIQAAQTTPAVRIRAYKNGEGSRYEPVLVVGTSVNSLLAQCTSRLALTKAARRLYTIDGQVITDVDELRSETLSYQNIHHSKKQSKHNTTSDAVDTVYTANQAIETGKDSYCDMGNKLSAASRSCHSNTHASRSATDVFVSCGEPFVTLEEVDKEYLLQQKHQSERTWVETHLETEKHVLRQIQGRRISGHLPPEISSGQVTSWQDMEKLEVHKQENIYELSEHLKDLKCKQRVEKEQILRSKSNTNRKLSNNRLYNGVKTVRVNVFENGKCEQEGVKVCGTNIIEIMDLATARLSLPSSARRMFTKDGIEIESVTDLVKGCSYCVSCGENFILHSDRQNTVERKATWSRLNKMSGGAMSYRADETSSNLALALIG